MRVKDVTRTIGIEAATRLSPFHWFILSSCWASNIPLSKTPRKPEQMRSRWQSAR
jgi:hypothetical protein